MLPVWLMMFLIIKNEVHRDMVMLTGKPRLDWSKPWAKTQHVVVFLSCKHPTMTPEQLPNLFNGCSCWNYYAQGIQWPWIIRTPALISSMCGFQSKCSTSHTVCVCGWNIWTDVKLLPDDVVFCCSFGFRFSLRDTSSTSTAVFNFNIHFRAGARSVMVSLLPTKTLTIDGDTRLGQSGVPALLWSPVVQGLLPFKFHSLTMGRGSTQEPPWRFVQFPALHPSVIPG